MIHCAVCKGTIKTGCACIATVRQLRKMTIKSKKLPANDIQSQLLQYKLDAETDDEYDVGKDW